MRFTTSSAKTLAKTPVLVLGVYSNATLGKIATQLDSQGEIKKIVKKEFAKAELGSTLVLRRVEGIHAERVLLIGLGKADDFGNKALLAAHSAVVDYLKQTQTSDAIITLLQEDHGLAPELAAQLAARALETATYQYSETLSQKPDPIVLKKIVFSVTKADQAAVDKGLAQGQALGRGMNLTRYLGDLPGNICTPTFLGQQAKALAKAHESISAEVLERKQIEALRMGSFLSVAAGSDQDPRFIVLRYTPKTKRKQKPIVLVGKGVTFDTGGISLKPGLKMDEMKWDMCGAATVFGVFQTIAEINLDREVIGLVPATENMPSGRATKPGDVVTSLSGQTIEILNTDAEGRLILCDALTYAERFNPEAVIDMATLTGAIIVSLGHVNTGLFANNDDLAAELLAAGKTAADPAWHMPIGPEYDARLKSQYADMANIADSPAGGSITAACFLARFTKAYAWAHLDIAGTSNGGGKKGATGRPVPLLLNYLLSKQG